MHDDTLRQVACYQKHDISYTVQRGGLFGSARVYGGVWCLLEAHTPEGALINLARERQIAYETTSVAQEAVAS